MSEDTKIEQSYHYQTDQQVSVNAYFEADINGETVRFQITNRYGASAEKITRTVKASIEAYAELRKEYPRVIASVPAPVQEVTRVPIDDNGNPLPSGTGNNLPPIKHATAGRLSFDVKDGKTFWKIMDAVFASGEKGTKYGVTIWPEALTAAGLDISQGQPVPQINGWAFEYVCNEKGYPQKVTRLLPPKS